MTVDVEMKNGQRNYRVWQVTIFGREGTLWEGGEFPGTLEFGNDYPNSPPRYRWKLYGNMKFYHMNIFESGSTCIDILNDKIGYTPARTAVEILKAMEDFLYAPNPKSPTKGEWAKLYETNRAEWEKNTREFVKAYMNAKGG